MPDEPQPLGGPGSGVAAGGPTFYGPSPLAVPHSQPRPKPEKCDHGYDPETEEYDSFRSPEGYVYCGHCGFILDDSKAKKSEPVEEEQPPQAQSPENGIGQLSLLDATPVPDSEILEAIHIVVGPGRMACGKDRGIGVHEADEDRVTCPDCKAWLDAGKPLD